MLSARLGVSDASTTAMSDSLPSLCAVAYAIAATSSVARAHFDARESHGGIPTTTPRGRRAGALKARRNSSTTSPSKSEGRATPVSRDSTDILRTVETESVAFSVSRHAEAGSEEEAVCFGRGLVAQATSARMPTTGATESRGMSTACTRRVQAQLETEVGPHARLHLLGSPERHPDEVDFHLLDAWQCHHFVLGVGHKLRTRWARRRSQCHIDFDRRSIDGNAVDEPEIHDVELQIGIFDAAECELHLIFRDDARGRGRFGCGKSWRRFFAHGGCRIIARITRNKKGRRWRPFSIGNKAYFFFFLLEVLFFALERLFEVA